MAAVVVAWLRGLSNTGRALGRENGQPGEGDTRFLTGCSGHCRTRSYSASVLG